MMRRTHYSLPDYDDTAPPRTYRTEIDHRNSLEDYNNEYKDDDGHFDQLSPGIGHPSCKYKPLHEALTLVESPIV